jgi:acetyl-CoA carboxylase biotin carboxyl carrier protein
MDLKEIRQLIRLVEKADIGELEIVEDGKKVKISKNSGFKGETVFVQNPLPPPYNTSPIDMSSNVSQNVTESSPAAQGTTRPSEPVPEHSEVRSPMVGTFYRAPSPESDVYVEVGQQIDVGQTLCIIEAMKLMNEVESEISGKIVKVLVENAQPVEYNQVLFLVEK